MTACLPLVVGISGSSAPQYGIRLLRALREVGSHEVHLVLSRGAEATIRLEAGMEPDDVRALADHCHDPGLLDIVVISVGVAPPDAGAGARMCLESLRRRPTLKVPYDHLGRLADESPVPRVVGTVDDGCVQDRHHSADDDERSERRIRDANSPQSRSSPFADSSATRSR
jgi:hypothetical protein